MIVYHSGITNELRNIRNLLNRKRESKRDDFFPIPSRTDSSARPVITKGQVQAMIIYHSGGGDKDWRIALATQRERR